MKLTATQRHNFKVRQDAHTLACQTALRTATEAYVNALVAEGSDEVLEQLKASETKATEAYENCSEDSWERVYYGKPCLPRGKK